MLRNKDIISSRNNNIVKWAASLADKKGRLSEGAFIAEGEKLVFEAIRARLPVTQVFINENRLDSLMPKIEAELSDSVFEKTVIYTLSEGAFDKISTEKSPQGIICVIKHLDFFRNMDIIYKEEFFLSKGERALALCSLRDPGNLGSVIRSAVAFGVEHIVLTSDCADIYNPKTVRSAMGSLFKIKITTVKDFDSFVRASRAVGRRVFAAELSANAKSLSDISVLSEDIFIIGNEGHGIPSEISSICDGSVYIPISDKTESLNASVAAAVFMWEQNK